MTSNNLHSEYYVNRITIVYRIILFSVLFILFLIGIAYRFSLNGSLYYILTIPLALILAVGNVMSTSYNLIKVDGKMLSHTFYKNYFKKQNIFDLEKVEELRLVRLGHKFKIIDLIWPSVRSIDNEILLWSKNNGLIDKNFKNERTYSLIDNSLVISGLFIEIKDSNSITKKIPIFDIKERTKLVEEITDRVEEN